MLEFTKHIAAPQLKDATSVQELILIVRKSPFSKKQLNQLAKKLELSTTQAAVIAGTDLQTYQSMKADSELSSSASESMLKLAEVYQNGLNAFNNNEKSFLGWAKEPIPALNKAIPQELMTTVLGVDLVNQELLRIEHSIFY
ncbi:MAG: antitoxin Xre/MbcA/ParS toxin-binding domain-containing protein [Cyclobacteriaceae bacterium]